MENEKMTAIMGKAKKKRGRKAKSKVTAVAAPKKRGRKPGRKPGPKPAGAKRGRKPAAVKGIKGKVNFSIAGGVLIMNNIPSHVNTMVFVKGTKLTSVDI
jgi:hypothetical protein